MIQHSGSRLAVTATILLLQSLMFIFELLIFSKSVRRTSWYIPLRQLFGPALVTLLGAILVPITFTHATSRLASQAGPEQCHTSVDGDIAGTGAQIAVWAQVGVLLLISILGSFHTSATGAKEIGAGLLLTHVSLAIAILLQMRLGVLTSVDAVVSAMVLDAQNVGLSIQLGAKETLAARWQVRIAVVVQAFGMVVIAVLVDGFVGGAFATESCECLTVFWWAWLSSCGASTAREMPVFWTYYACRCVCFCQTAFHALYNADKFDAAEKSQRAAKMEREADAALLREGLSYRHAEEQNWLMDILRGALPPREIQVEISNQEPSHIDNDTPQAERAIEEDRRRSTAQHTRLRRSTHVYRRLNGQTVFFDEYPATVTLMYAIYGIFSLASMGTVQTTVTQFNLDPPSAIDSVGQVIALVVAAATLGRAAWLFFMLFRDEKRSGKWHFVWPFKLTVVNDLIPWATYAVMGEDYTPCYRFRHEPTLLPLGAILTDPFDLASGIGAHWPSVEGRGVELDVEEEVKHSSRQNYALEWSFGVGSWFGLGSVLDRVTIQDFRAHNLATSHFDPKLAAFTTAITDRIQDPLVKAHRGTQTVYMVTGTKVAELLHIVHNASKMYSDGWLGWRRDSELEFQSDSEILIGYRLYSFRWSRREGTFVMDDIYRIGDDW